MPDRLTSAVADTLRQLARKADRLADDLEQRGEQPLHTVARLLLASNQMCLRLTIAEAQLAHHTEQKLNS
jgi:hypothetical protein